YSDHLSANDAAAFQLAIWKIEYDGIGSTISDFKDGNFRADGPNAVIDQAILWFNDVVTGVFSEATAATDLFALTNPCVQDQLVHAPEPSSLCLGIVGAVAVAATWYRRRQRARPIACLARVR